jgi:polyphosphate kinase
LRPGVKGLSENITVRSVVDRFLEHSRIYYFENSCQPQLFVSSADWMQRNFFRRIELAFPIEDGVLRERLIAEILAVSLADNTKARNLQQDGTYVPVTPKRGEKARRSQFEFIALASSDESSRRKRVGGKPRFPQVKLAPSPFAKRKVR